MVSSRLVHISSSLRTQPRDLLIVGLRRLVVSTALPILASACVPADALIPHTPSTLDEALADVAHPALENVDTFFSGAGIITPQIVPARCPYESSSQSFACAPLSGGGLTLTQRFTLLDAAGGKQSAFDPATTTGLHLENAVAGTWNQETYSYTIDGQQTLDLTGLGSARRTLNGTSLTLRTETYANRVGHPPVKTELRTTITDLVIPVVASGQPRGWPVSGTIDVRSLSDYGEELPAGGTTVVFIATMRFSGSSLVDLTVTIPGGIQSCKVDITLIVGLGCRESRGQGRPIS